MSPAADPIVARRLRTRRRQAVGFLASGALLACAEAAHAQSTSGLGVGVPGVPSSDKRVTLDAHAEATYDSNVTGGNSSVASTRNLSPEDEIYTVGTNVTLMLPSSRQLLFIDGAADFARYGHNSILDGDNYRLSAGAAERLGVCSATLVGGYSHRVSQIQDLALANVAKNIATQDTGNVDVTCGRRSVFVDVSGNVTKVENSAKGSGFVNSVTSGGNAAIGYHNQVLGDVSLMAIYSDIHYDPADLLLTPIPGLPTSVPDVRQYGAGVKYSRKVGLRLSGTVSLFYTNISGGLVNTQSDGLNVSASLAYRLTSRTQFTLDYNLGNNASSLATTSYVRSENLHFTGTYNLTQRITLQAGASHGRDEYRGADQLAVLQLRESTSNEIDGSVNVKVGRKITVNLTATHLERTADIHQFDYTSDRISVGLSGRF